MGPKTTPSLISKGGYQIPPPLGGREIDTPWEIGLTQFLLYSFEEVDLAPNCVQFQSPPFPQQTPTLFKIFLTFKNFIITEPAF